MRRRRHPPAELPVNVQLTYADGTVVPVDCRYNGWDQDRRHHTWQIINPRPHEVPVRITADRLPAHTAFVLIGDAR